ncbi:MAG TPA: efflux RND transporter periplasmic adaptor subunit, partial [Burkholderiales bacterium]|nr:efflux RND transporter periplasmic adaptor subunit [Burkholderiales bacterium]
TVSATGKLQPTNQVDVGSELSGTIEQVFVDDNDLVKQGQVIARLDVSKLKDQVAKSRAAVAAAEAQLKQMQATEAEARANLARLRQVAVLSGGKVPSKAEMETAEASVARAIANIASARATIAQAVASLRSDETNLAKASIRSPINGVILTRKVEPGQTVAASFQAPVLFTIAEDLTKMRLEVDVDEADVGSVREGQSATFSVDAYPNRRYPSDVTRVGYGAQTKENVVSYLTVLTVDNSDLSLRPGMTGTADIVTAQRSNVLLVSNAALRFSPPPTNAAAKKSGGLLSAMLPRPPRSQTRPTARAPGEAQRVWVLRDGTPTPIAVTAGPTDGRMTELTGGEVQEGMQVITEAYSAPK